MTINMTLLDMSWFPLESRTIPVHGGFLQVFFAADPAEKGGAGGPAQRRNTEKQ